MVDCDFVFGMIETDDFIKFNNEKAFEQCLDIEEKPTIRVTDEQAKKIIMKYSKCRSISEFEVLPTDLKEKYIKNSTHTAFQFVKFQDYAVKQKDLWKRI